MKGIAGRPRGRTRTPRQLPDQPVVHMQELTCTLAGRTVLADIELRLRAGEVLAVIGCNGAGKSTLLKHVTGEFAAKGTVALFGREPHAHEQRALARRRAVLPQSTQLDFGYEVIEVVLLGRIPHQRSRNGREPDREVAQECLRRVGLEGFEHRNYLTLSGGEQQRVHLARALAQLHGTDGERLLILDEPTSSLDIAYQHQVLKLARELATTGVGVLAVLHDLNLAAQYADRVLVLARGRVLAYGSPYEVLVPPVLQEAFGHEVIVMRHPCMDCPLIVSAG